ncbi:hypothetical protein ACWDCC_40105 [Streptomyces sp. NPDC001102]
MTVDTASIRPVRPNQGVANQPEESAIRAAQDAFNHTSCTMLQLWEGRV